MLAPQRSDVGCSSSDIGLCAEASILKLLPKHFSLIPGRHVARMYVLEGFFRRLAQSVHFSKFVVKEDIFDPAVFRVAKKTKIRLCTSDALSIPAEDLQKSLKEVAIASNSCNSKAIKEIDHTSLLGTSIPVRFFTAISGPDTKPPYPNLKRSVTNFKHDGYLLLQAAMTNSNIEDTHQWLDDLWVTDRNWRGHGVTLESIPTTIYFGHYNSSRMTLTAAPNYIRERPYRIYCPRNRQFNPIAYDKLLIGTLRALFGILHDSSRCVKAAACLFFERGSQQGLHDDVWYGLGSNQEGGMIGAWFSFDDADDTNGPLIYVPGSHLRPTTYLRPTAATRQDKLSLPLDLPSSEQPIIYKNLIEEIANLGLSVRTFHARQGDIFLWNERLIHGGSPIKDLKRTRRSMVIHYKHFDCETWP